MQDFKHSESENFRDDLVERVAQTNRPKLVERVSPWGFRDENQEGRINLLKNTSSFEELLNCLNHIPHDHRPVHLEEKSGKPVWTK